MSTGSSDGALRGGSPEPRTSSSLRVDLIVGAALAKTQLLRRQPQFISLKTKGVKITLTGTATYTATFDLSPGSVPCAGILTSPRTCKANLTGVVAGSYTVTAKTYDLAPVAGAIPLAAHLLATGSVSGVSVQLGTANVTALVVSGIISSYGNTAFISVPNDGSSHQVGFALAPQDLAAEGIVAGVKLNDTYANPLTLTLSESGGSGHETLVKNGINVGNSATVTRSTDAVQINYDGGGSPGYSGSVAITAAGVTTVIVSISPLYVTPSNYVTGNTITFLANGETSTLMIAEANAPNTVHYAATATPDCGGVATASTPGGVGASASSTVTAGISKSSGGCTITIADNLGTATQVAYAIVNLTFAYTSVMSAVGSLISNLSPGPDGKIWAVDTGKNAIETISLAGTVATLSNPTATFKPRYITSGPDGNMWVSDQDRTAAQSKIECIRTTGVSCGIFPVPAGAMPAGIVAGRDGNLWFAAVAPNTIDRITPQGVITRFGSAAIGMPDATSGPQLALAADGNVWFTELGDTIGRITPSGVITEFNAGITPGARTYGLTRAPDGSLWFTEFSGGRIGHITFDPSGNPTIAEIAPVSSDSPVTTVSKPWDITVGGDGNVWFVQSHSIGRLSPAGTLNVARTNVNVPALNGNIGITTAADGSVWFGDGQTGTIPLGGPGGPYVTKVIF